MSKTTTITAANGRPKKSIFERAHANAEALVAKLKSQAAASIAPVVAKVAGQTTIAVAEPALVAKRAPAPTTPAASRRSSSPAGDLVAQYTDLRRREDAGEIQNGTAFQFFRQHRRALVAENKRARATGENSEPAAAPSSVTVQRVERRAATTGELAHGTVCDTWRMPERPRA